MLEGLLLAVLLAYVIGGLAALFSRNSRITPFASFIPSFVGSALAVILAIVVVISPGASLGQNSAFQISIMQNATPIAGGFDFLLDGTAAFFVLIIGLISSAASIYSIGYTSEYLGKRNLSAMGFLFNIFILSMILVVLSNNAFAFLVFWELMSLVSFFLVIYEHEKESTIRSGMRYLIMTHLGTAFILASFLTLYFYTGSLNFDSFRHLPSSIPVDVKGIVFVLGFIGFGTKAGIVPLHTWLPRAHPAAPSNVSALMSGVMIKTAIYGLVRIVFDFSGLQPAVGFAWWGIVILSSGIISSIVGVLYAVVEHDMKRALAFHSIENIGIILTGLGLSVIFYSYDLVSLSFLALAASMYHTLNHAIFKSLLFMGAGSVLFSTHTRNVERMGGLIKKMPWTALFFLIGAISIAGLPPLNGFISEWLTMQALLASYQVPSAPLQLGIAFGGLVFALTVGLAAATFVKLFGISFLSKSRSKDAEYAKEVPTTMLVGKALLACCCAALGLLPFFGLNLIASAFNFPSSLRIVSPLTSVSTGMFANINSQSSAILSMPMAAMLLCSFAVAAYGFSVALGGKPRRTAYETWDCGFGGLTERMEYTATSLSQPIRTVFKWFFKPQNTIQKETYPASGKYLRQSFSVKSTTRDLFEEWLYLPVVGACIWTLDKVRRMQTGKINTYILYIMIILVLLLIAMVIS
ncbi:MAG: hydrogenase 4 subunit B [Nitrososphaerota archaeon]|nr:hydrogenase 4 subunit B [Nitrososphaerota archaeon]